MFLKCMGWQCTACAWLPKLSMTQVMSAGSQPEQRRHRWEMADGVRPSLSFVPTWLDAEPSIYRDSRATEQKKAFFHRLGRLQPCVSWAWLLVTKDCPGIYNVTIYSHVYSHFFPQLLVKIDLNRVHGDEMNGLFWKSRKQSSIYLTLVTICSMMFFFYLIYSTSL